MAPEIILHKPYSGPSVDLFACGIILFIMISGIPPFLGADPKKDVFYKLFCTGKADLFWKAHERNKPKVEGRTNFYSDDFMDLIHHMLALDSSKRFNIEQIKKHSWYNGPIVEKNKIKEEFLERKKIVDTKLKRQKEDKKKQKEIEAIQKCSGTNAFAAIKPFR